MQQVVTIPYQYFGTTYQSYLLESGFSLPLKMGPIDCSESSVQNYHHALHNPEKCGSHLLHGRNLKTWLLNFYPHLGVDVPVFLYTENKAASSSKTSVTVYHSTRCRIPVTILCELQISQTVIFPSLYSSLIPIIVFTQRPLSHIRHHINPVHIRKLYCSRSILVLSLYLILASVILFHEKYLRKARVLVMYCVCSLLTALFTTYYYKFTITSLHLLFPNSDKSCSKTE